MKYINSYYNIKIIFAHFFLVDLKRTSEQQQSKQNSRGEKCQTQKFLCFTWRITAAYGEFL